jgi:hypothetical protein
MIRQKNVRATIYRFFPFQISDQTLGFNLDTKSNTTAHQEEGVGV